MPELPEVQTVVDTLRPRVVGAVVARVEVIRAEYVEPEGVAIGRHLLGRRIGEIRRRGKRILVLLDDGNRVLIHLGMTGRVTVQRAGEQRRPHTHVVIGLRGLEGTGELIEVHVRDPRRFGKVVWLGKESGEEGLGPEPLEMTAKQLKTALVGTKTAVKAALLDQGRIAGLGNIYVDESLFVAGIHPLTPACEIDMDGCRRLCRAIRQVLRKALRHRGSSLRDYVDAEGAKGEFQRMHNVYGRAGEKCRRCKGLLEKLTVAGRTTCYCPRCQRTGQSACLRTN